jgi:hypothetical protein
VAYRRGADGVVGGKSIARRFLEPSCNVMRLVPQATEQARYRPESRCDTRRTIVRTTSSASRSRGTSSEIRPVPPQRAQSGRSLTGVLRNPLGGPNCTGDLPVPPQVGQV